MAAIEAHWPQGADVVHVHNPTLAKNRYLQAVLLDLQRAGIKLLCQIHDFAEDGRPAAYYVTPYLPDCHYAVVNPRDHRLLLQAGLDPRGCHLLPNAVPSSTSHRPASKRGDHVLYPVRAIRRKNIGEALLISHFLDEGVFLAITLPPNSAADAASYASWRSFARRRALPVQFDAGVHADFSKLLADCRFVLTTSITEGFGFVYLEPWMAGKALWGRLLPETCEGFIQQGVELQHLYPRLRVDLGWLDAGALERRWKAAFDAAARKFRGPASRPSVDAAWQQVVGGGCIDFGLLSEPFQRQVIERIMDDGAAAAALRLLNPFLEHFSRFVPREPVIGRNASIIAEAYNLDQYGRRLVAAYGSVADKVVSHAIDKRVLSQYFLSPRSFSLLKWEPFDG
jgi:hypothetical protein